LAARVSSIYGAFVDLPTRLDTVENTVATQLADVAINVKTRGVIGDGVTDDTSALLSILADVNVKSVYVPKGDYLLSGTGTELLLITKSMKIKGQGWLNSRFLIALSVPASTDIIRVSPLTNITNFSIEGIGFHPVSGTPARHAFHIDITAIGAFFKNGSIKKCNFGTFGGSSIKLTNPTNMDGFFTSNITENFISNGISLERSGDSVAITRNTIPGSNIGINLTTVPGAYRTFISENNITASGGAIALTDVSEVTITDNQIEQVVSGLPADSACVTITGGFNIIFENNNVDTNGYIDNCIAVDNTLRVVIDKNAFNTAINQLKVGPLAKDTFIGYKNVSRKDAILRENLYITNAGIGTTNIDVPVTLLNSWIDVDVANYGVARCHKTFAGTCHLKGYISTGTATVGTTLFVLPEGFRPSKAMHATCYSNSGSMAILGAVRILPTGEVSIRGGSNAIFGLDGISFKANSFLA